MIPQKTFARMLDLATEESTNKRMGPELDNVMDDVSWPWNASNEQIAEWNAHNIRLHAHRVHRESQEQTQ